MFVHDIPRNPHVNMTEVIQAVHAYPKKSKFALLTA